MGGGGGGGRGWDDILIGPPYVCVVLWENSLWFCYLASSSHSPPHPFFLGGGRVFYLPLTKSFSFFSFLKFIIENRSCMYMYEYWVSPPPWWFERKMKRKIYDELHKSRPPPPSFFNWSMERRSMYYRGERSGEWMRQVDKMELQRNQFHLINLPKRRRTNPSKKKSKHRTEKTRIPDMLHGSISTLQSQHRPSHLDTSWCRRKWQIDQL